MLYQTFFIDSVYSFSKIATFILLIIDVLVLYWRLIRRYHQMRLRHIIRELHYIADNNFDHRIPFKLNGDLGRVVNSVNRLVDSTVQALEEERRIEKSKDELITNISHDIRTPLTSIIGYLGLIEEEKYSNERELRHYTKTAYNKAKQMKVLVDDLFEYTKIRQPSAPLQLSSFDMCQLLEQLATDFELEAQRKQMAIDVVPPKRPIVMTGDTEKLVRVFNNLISNALKYGKGGKHILLNAEKVGSEVVVTVANDGATIPEKALNQVFERFYRVEASRSQETGGTGLGPAIAQSIIVLHGGYIFVKSENGGRHLSFIYPLNKEIRQMRKKEFQMMYKK